ncbi:unnamed protein product [Blepharisma stoltei]|uniref:Bromo domain-containing protein n=1 Tax=Blepharisma stoltei TaxID=1481888 RepID=A0AAU9IYA1_9CILI|nr:unnamed protein product [Blepharisma stoltei]
METRKFLTAEDELKACQMISLLELHDESEDFLEPVDWKFLNLPDYPFVIKNPIDLGTIKNKLNRKVYRNLSEFITDIQLIWDNCKFYNERSTDFRQRAEFLEKQMKRYCVKLRIPMPKGRLKRLKDKETAGIENSDTVTFEEKWEMLGKIKKLGQFSLEEVVRLIRMNAPEAVENEEKEKIRVKLDDLDRATFTRMQEIINESTSLESLPRKAYNA